MKNVYVEAAKSLGKNIGFILGFRKAYRLEILLTVLGIIAFTLSYITWGYSVYTLIITGIILLSPALFQYIQYKRKVRFYREVKEKVKIPPPTVPLFTIIVSAILSGLMPPLTIIAVINTFFIEDITVFLSEVDIVKMKRDFRILIEPITKRELLLLTVITIGSALLSYVVTNNPLVFTYPIISYIMVVYSLIFVPPEIRSEIRGQNILEEISRRIPFLYFLFRYFYQSSGMMRLGKEAGYIGTSYYVFIKRGAGVFTLSLYVSLAITPLLYIFIGNYAFLTPIVTAFGTFIAPYLVLRIKRNNRAGKINRNLMLILSYLASMASVAERFTSAMENLLYNTNLAKMFGLEREARIYINIYKSRNDDSLAMEEYANTIPDDFYRDTVRAIKDISENEGYGAVFRALVARLRDYTTRHIDRVATTFENIGGNVISVIVLMETTMPIMLFLSSPTMMPFFLLIAGVMSAFMISAIATMVLPDLPSEFIHAKTRYRKASMVFTITASLLTLMEYILLPELIHVLIILNIPVAFATAFYYSSLEDLKINNDFLNKFPDLLILFSSSIVRHNNVEKALLDLAQQGTFTRRMRRIFQKLAGIFALLNVERLTYRGPYWYKYFMFLTSISAKYGTTPRELYKTISDFMLEYKKFFATVSTFGKSILFMIIVALVIMNIEVQIVLNFLEVMSGLGLSKMTSQFGVESPIPELSPEELANMRFISYLALLLTSILNGVGVAKAASGTVRDAKWILIMFVLELILLYVGIHTSFGISFKMQTGTSTAP